MLSPIAKFYRHGYESPYWLCDCCDHNFSVFTMDSNEDIEGKKCHKSFRYWVTSLKAKRCRLVVQLADGRQGHDGKRQRLKKAFCLGDILKREKKCSTAESVIVRSEVPKESSPDPCQSHIHNALSSIYTSILESDTTLQLSPKLSKICFLVYLARDFDTTPPSLFTTPTLPPEASGLDEFASLSYASSWLQASLGQIRDSFFSSSGQEHVQMAFVDLETEFQTASARAASLQRMHPSKRVEIATLDLVALREKGCVVSAFHAFKMLRVPVGNGKLEGQLLLWMMDSRKVADAMLAVMEWKGEKRAHELSDFGDPREYNVARGVESKSGQPMTEESRTNRESNVTNCTSSKRFSAAFADWETIDKESLLDSDSCWF